MRRRAALLTALGFLLFLGSPLASAVFFPSTESFENRDLTDFPDLELSLESGRQLLGYLSDRMSARTLAIRMAARVDVDVFGQSPNPNRVLFGNDDWLFLRDTFEAGCTPGLPRAAADSIVDFVTALEALESRVLFTVAPDKRSVTREQLTEDLTELGRCASLQGEQLREALNRDDIRFLDLWAALTATDLQHHSTYFRDDSHFNDVGSRVFVEGLISGLGFRVDLEWTAPDTTSRQGNLARLIGLDRFETTPLVELIASQPTLVRGFDSRFGPDTFATQQWRSSSPFIDKRLLVLGDSFMDQPRRSISAVFEEVMFTDWRDSDSVETFISSAPCFDLILIETAEHELWERFGTAGNLSSDLKAVCDSQ